MSLMNALGSMMGGSKNYCPDCGSQVGSNGCCSDCGYGEDDMMEDDSEDKAEMQSLLDLRDTLQNALKQVDRLIVGGEFDSKPEPTAPPQQIVWVRQK